MAGGAARGVVLAVTLGVATGVAGLLVGVLAIGVHRQALVIEGTPLPWGLVLVVVSLYAGTRAATLLGGTRTGAFPFAGGIGLALLAATAPTGSGDVLLASDVRGWGLILGGAAAVGLALVRAVRSPTVGA